MFFRELNSFFRKTCFFRKMFFPNLYRSHHLFSCLYKKNTAFGPFRRPDGISESRSSSPLSKSVAPIRLNLVPPKPDCSPYQQTSLNTTSLVQLQTNEKTCVLFTCFNHNFSAVFKTFFFLKLANPATELPTLKYSKFMNCKNLKHFQQNEEKQINFTVL